MPDIPNRVVLGSTGFRVQETSDQEIIFTEDMPIYGCASTMVFWKHDDNGYPGIWYASLGGRGQIGEDKVCPGKFCEAFRLVQQWRGRNFEPWHERRTQESDQ